jgi:hypothetical protein
MPAIVDNYPKHGVSGAVGISALESSAFAKASADRSVGCLILTNHLTAI